VGVNGDNRPSTRRKRAEAVDLMQVRPASTLAVVSETAHGPAGEMVPAPAAVTDHLRSAATPAPAARTSAVPSAPARAGVVTRLLAAAVDSAAVVLVTVLLDLAAAGARFVWSPVTFRWPRPAPVVAVVVLLVVAAAYLTLGWALTGRTYGARLMGLRVLTSRHELLGWTRSVLRALTCVIWPLGLLWCGVSRTRKSLADIVVRSVVVYDAAPYARIREVPPPRTAGSAS
jgi:uncharacterized RDD family membrane protein YckC